MVEYDYDDYLMDEEGGDVLYQDFLAEDEDGLGPLSPWEEKSPVPPMSALKMLENCVWPTSNDAFKHVLKVLLWCLIYRVTTQIVRIPEWLRHIISFSCGSVLMYHFFGPTMKYLLIQGVIAYSALFVSHFVLKNYRGWISMAACILFIIICELLVVDTVQWHTVRAAQMLVAMRAISVGFDLDEKKSDSPQFVNFLGFFGYLYCPGTIIFGPWVPYGSYLSLQNNHVWNLKWILRIFVCVFLSMTFLSVSSCWALWLVPPGSFKWFLAFRDALSFRSSHYFVSFLSEAAAIAVGLGWNPDGNWSFTVSKPLNVEFPRSLVDVVVSWNLPMHTWLRIYVFRVARPYGTFFAILGTYAISALLHGLNFQLAAVLLSLGLYTYTEHMLRQKLAAIFSACILAKKCKANCSHRYKEDNAAVKLTNVAFGCLAAFHLAYLGLMFDSSPRLEEKGYNYLHTLNKWRWLGFTSHWVVLATYIISMLI